MKYAKNLKKILIEKLKFNKIYKIIDIYFLIL